MSRSPVPRVAAYTAYVAVALALVAVGVLALAPAGCREPEPASSADSLVKSPGASAATTGSTAAQGSPSWHPAVQPPTAPKPSSHPATPRSLVDHGARGGRKIVAIVFQMEAAPGEPGGVDQDILDTLRTDNVRATFFMAGIWVQAHPGAAKQIASDSNFEVGNGGYSSEYLSRMSPDLIKQRTRRAQQIIGSLAGANPVVYRNAQTRYTGAAVGALASIGLRPIAGDIDLTSVDPKLSAQGIADAALHHVQTGSIVVMRGDTNDPRQVRALVFLLGGLKRAGYDDVTVSQLIGLQ